MNQSCRRPIIAERGIVLLLTIVSWPLIGFHPVIAQQIQNRLPGLQAPVSDNLESQILGRISVTGEYQPEDLPRLARLTVLESISTLVNITDDLRDSPLGIRLESEATSLWDASQVFSETVSSGPLDLTTLSRAQSDYVDVGAAYRQLKATMGELPGASVRAADNLQAVTSLLSATNEVAGAMEADLLRTVPLPVDRSLDLDQMREQSQRLANDLVVLIGKVSDPRGGGARRDGVLEDLNGMLTLVQDFGRRLPLQLAFKELQESFRVIRRRMWHVEAKIFALEWPADLQRQWRLVRERTNAISDDFGLPRVIVLAPRVPRAAGSNHKLVAQVDRSVAWVDEYLAEVRPELRKTPAGARFEADVVKLRRLLLEFRRSATANESTERLARAVREIEVTNQGLAGLARDLDRDHRDDIVSRFRNPAQAVNSLRDFIARQ